MLNIVNRKWSTKNLKICIFTFEKSTFIIMNVDLKQIYVLCFTHRAVVVEWQTRYLEGVVGVYPWRFESSLPHTE